MMPEFLCLIYGKLVQILPKESIRKYLWIQIYYISPKSQKNDTKIRKGRHKYFSYRECMKILSHQSQNCGMWVKSLDIAGTTTVFSLQYNEVYWAIQNYKNSNGQYKLQHIDGKQVAWNSIRQRSRYCATSSNMYTNNFPCLGIQ